MSTVEETLKQLIAAPPQPDARPGGHGTDLAEIKTTLRDHTATLEEVNAKLSAVLARFDER